MAESLGQAVLELRTSDSGLEQGISKARRDAESLDSTFKRVGDNLSGIGKGLSAAFTAPLVAIGAGALKSAIDFESAFAGVIKTVDATEEELAVLRQGIRDMATEIPAAATEIAGVAEAAGQLGIQTENILEFTRVMIDLGNATNLSAAEAATALARLANITQMPQSEFDRLGATIVDLGNNLATTEAEIVDMSLRLAGAGSQVGMTEAQILSFAGALSSVGIAAEAGGSAFSKVMIDIASQVEMGGEQLERYARVAGMSAEEFASAWREDAAAALVAFIEGLGRLGAEGESVFLVLEDLEITEVRMRDALLRAAGAGDLFRESLELGTKAWEENAALTAEASRRYETTESRLQILWNRLKDVALTLGEALLPAFHSALDAIQPLIGVIGGLTEKFAALDEDTRERMVKFAAIFAAAGPVLMALGAFTSAVSALASPTGAVILAITSLVAAGTWVIDNWEEIKQKAIEVKDWVVRTVQNMVEAVTEWFGESKLGRAVQSVGNALDRVVGFFRRTEDEVVGHSIVPDMVRGVLAWFALMEDGISTTSDRIADRVVEAFDRAAGGVEGFSRSASSALVSFFDAVAAGDKTFADFGSTLKEFLLRMLSGLEVQVLAQQAAGIATAIAQAPVTFGASLAYIPTILAESAATLLVFEGLKAVIRGLAEGGTAVSPGLTLVGERGPEILHLPAGASVIPLDRNIGGPREQIIQVWLDGRMIARAAAQGIPEVVRLATGIRTF